MFRFPYIGKRERSFYNFKAVGIFLPTEALLELETCCIARKTVFAYACIILKILNLLREALTESEPRELMPPCCAWLDNGIVHEREAMP
jgi:hypothetical protein